MPYIYCLGIADPVWGLECISALLIYWKFYDLPLPSLYSECECVTSQHHLVPSQSVWFCSQLLWRSCMPDASRRAPIEVFQGLHAFWNGIISLVPARINADIGLIHPYIISSCSKTEGVILQAHPRVATLAGNSHSLLGSEPAPECVHAYVYVNVYTWVHVSKYTCISMFTRVLCDAYVYMPVITCVHVHMCAGYGICVHVNCMWLCLYVCTSMSVCMYTFVCEYVCVHIPMECGVDHRRESKLLEQTFPVSLSILSCLPATWVPFIFALESWLSWPWAQVWWAG